MLFDNAAMVSRCARASERSPRAPLPPTLQFSRVAARGEHHQRRRHREGNEALDAHEVVRGLGDERERAEEEEVEPAQWNRSSHTTRQGRFSARLIARQTRPLFSAAYTQPASAAARSRDVLSSA